ncbi:MAG TPA: amidohydrolase family protein [Frankiaceae bacterium]|jgi:cytosine/adenosine deaminase-related metal-dependent hydrolase|nr:amidohydrolase family protein [Frankiaceae bacterium]
MQLHVAPQVVPIAAAPLRDGGVLVDGGWIVAVGPAGELRQRAAAVTEHPGVLMPGLVNAHAHLQYGPSFADLAVGGMAFPDWIGQMMQRRMLMSDGGWRAEVAQSWELARASGTVAVADIVTNVVALDVDVPGVRYLESVAIASDGWPAERDRLDPVLAGHHDTGLSPHTLYTIGTAVLRGSIELARQNRRRLHPHLAETIDEDQFVRHGEGPFAAFDFAAELRGGAGNGRSPAEYLDSIGGLGTDVHVAHGTHLGEADRALLRSRGTAVALCTRSNAILEAGVPPIAALLREGGPIAVGTDSLASTPDLDLLAEARALVVAAAAQGYEESDLAARILHACTAGGAYAIGRPDLGVLATGASAALAHVTVDDPASADIVAEIMRTGRAEPVRAQADSIT